MALCLFCGKRQGGKGRGLCARCYATPAVLARFPDGRTLRRYEAASDEPTEEELERIIAEQMKRLPFWWPKDGTKDVDPEGDE